MLEKTVQRETSQFVLPPNVIRIIKSRNMTWAEHVERTAKMINARKIVVSSPEDSRPLAILRRDISCSDCCEFEDRLMGYCAVLSGGSLSAFKISSDEGQCSKKIFPDVDCDITAENGVYRQK